MAEWRTCSIQSKADPDHLDFIGGVHGVYGGVGVVLAVYGGVGVIMAVYGGVGVILAVYGGVGVILAVNVEAVEGRNKRNVCARNRSQKRCFVLFDYVLLCFILYSYLCCVQ